MQFHQQKAYELGFWTGFDPLESDICFQDRAALYQIVTLLTVSLPNSCQEMLVRRHAQYSSSALLEVAVDPSADLVSLISMNCAEDAYRAGIIVQYAIVILCTIIVKRGAGVNRFAGSGIGAVQHLSVGVPALLAVAREVANLCDNLALQSVS
jgi:hypothetical protein